MKKRKTRKLALHRETLRRLGAGPLAAVAGGCEHTMEDWTTCRCTDACECETDVGCGTGGGGDTGHDWTVCVTNCGC